jgi:hypothetical protein
MRLSSTHCIVTFQGVPLGEVDVEPAELVIAELRPAPAYESIRPTIRAGSEALWALGFTGTPATGCVSTEALGAAARLDLELRDANGGAVAADWINVIEWPEADRRPTVMARIRHTPSADPATARVAPRGGGQSPEPDV